VVWCSKTGVNSAVSIDRTECTNGETKECRCRDIVLCSISMYASASKCDAERRAEDIPDQAVQSASLGTYGFAPCLIKIKGKCMFSTLSVIIGRARRHGEPSQCQPDSTSV
jgi:hypothetical protein